MATDQYPQRNVTMPMDEHALARARAKLDPGVSAGMGSRALPNAPSNGKGSRREVRPGEWIDDRVIIIGGPASPSEDSPPEWKKSDRAIPVFDQAKVYQVTLGKPCIFAGRALAPAKSYQMTGATCLDANVQPCIVDAVELGDVPTEPDVAPSEARDTASK